MSNTASLFDDIVWQRVFDRPPLSFYGNKRNFKNKFCQILRDLDLDTSTLIVDLFGGSAYLSHLAASVYDKNKIIWNDFDNYALRLEQMPQTKEIYLQFKKIIGNLPRETKLEPAQVQAIKEVLSKYETYDNKQICNWLFVMGREANIPNCNVMFNRLPLSFEACEVEQYIKPNVSRVSMDFRELAEQMSAKKVLYLADPPYLNTDDREYKAGFKEKDLIELLEFLKDKDFIFFSSEKSQPHKYLDEIIKREYFTHTSLLALAFGRNGKGTFETHAKTNRDLMFVCVKNYKGQ